MAILGNLFVKLGLKNETFDKGIKDSGKKVGTFAQGLKKVGGLIAATFAVGAVVNFTKQVLNAYNIQAQAENQLLVALKGRRDVQQDLIKQAGELQGKTLFGDEETIQAQALIAAFVKEGDQIKRVIPLVQDLATAKNMQLAVSADLVSKTLGSSTNALSRYGIEVVGAVGSVERLESLMSGLNDAFGGQAEAAAKVGTGALTQLENKWGDIKEQIGGSIANSEEFAGAMDDVGNALIKISDNLDGFIKLINGLKKFSELLSGVAIIDWIKGMKESTEVVGGGSDSVEEYTDTLELLAAAYEKLIPKWDDGSDSAEHAAGTIGALKDETEKLTKSLDDYGVNQEAEIQKTLKQIAANKELIKTLTSIKHGQSDVPGAMTSIGTPESIGVAFESEEGLANMDSFRERMAGQLESFTTDFLSQEQMFIDEMNNMMGAGVGEFVSVFAEGLGQLASGNIGLDQFFLSILDTIASFLGQLGKMLIAYGIAESALITSFDPVSKIAAGVALVAISGVISGFASKGLSNAGSSVAYSGGGGGSYSGSSSQQPQDNRVVFELDGTRLIGVINNTNRRRSVTG